MLRIWGRASAFNVQKVMWTIGEIGLDHERIDLGGAFGGLDNPIFLAMNPNGQIPVIEDGGVIVWESHAILRYLAASYSEGRLWDPDPAARALADRWMDWAQTALQPAFMRLFWGLVRTPEEARDADRIEKARQRLLQHYDLLDRHLAAQPYLAGDHFTLADIPAGTSLYRFNEMAIERPPLANLRAWYDRLTGRPAYRAHVMIPFDELSGRTGY